MPYLFRDSLENALKSTGRSMREVADTAGVSYEQFKSLRQGKSQTTNVEDAVKVAAAFGVTLDQFLLGNLSPNPTTPIVGTVGAGARVPVFEAYENGAGPRVACPLSLPCSEVVAVVIEGDSMEPVYSAGDLLFYTRLSADGFPTEAIGRRCVCETEDGFGWVKQVRRGSEPGLFNLISLNPSADNQHNVRLKWAAPVLLHWPRELTHRM